MGAELKEAWTRRENVERISTEMKDGEIRNWNVEETIGRMHSMWGLGKSEVMWR